MARNESQKVCKMSRWFLSPQDHAPLAGAFQDGLIGLAELTKNNIKFNKWHAMNCFGDIFTKGLNYKFQGKTFTNRDLISRLLPSINLLNRKPAIYQEQYNHLLDYDDEDINVNIVRGELQSGVLDKSTAGQGRAGSIFHIIANEFNNDVALETIYNFQQIVHRFFLYHGFTVGVNDINISSESVKEVKRRIGKMMLASKQITDKLNRGKLIAPLGMRLIDFYEAEQTNALAAGDDFIHPIFSDIDLRNNGMARLILSGSKGKPLNFIAINGAIGVQSINGKRFSAQAGWGRTSPYFVRYDTSPASRGYISTSFREGVQSDVYPFMAGEARHGMISNALSTSITGYQNRISVKNLETILTNNLRASTKGMNIVQPLYAETGLNPSRTESVSFPTVLISDKELKDRFKCEQKHLHKKYRSKANLSILNDEFKQIVADREEFRNIHLKLEAHNPRAYIFEHTKQMPVNIIRIIDNTSFNYSELRDETGDELDPQYVSTLVSKLCSELGYIYSNEIQAKRKARIPPHICMATKLMTILIRSYCCMRYLLDHKINNHLFDIIIQQITFRYKRALIDYGFSVGILAAQCISEPMTQFILDSKHRTGGQGGTQTNEIIRIKEILGARSTKDMKNPHMLIMIKSKYENDKIMVQEIANHIEQITLNRFITSTRVFFESFGKPTHPDFKHEESIIKQIIKHNYGMKIPGDLAEWCIRFDLDKEGLILKSIKLEIIITAIRKVFPQLFIIYTPENSKNIFIRCYLRNSLIKAKPNYLQDIILPLIDELKQVIVRGISGLISTQLVEVIKHINQPDGSLKRQKVYGINAVGHNMADVLSNEYVDAYRTQCDSVEGIETTFGIVAARNKIINEMIVTLGNLNRIHCSVFADEMCYTGRVTSIQKTGLQIREMDNITLRLSFQSPIQVMQDASVNGLTDRIGGISGPLIMGSMPRAGTTYNQIAVDEEFLKANIKNLDDELEDL